MKWKYFIPHVWDSPEQRTTWEDVWLLPEDGRNDGKSYWFTLNALIMGAAGVGEDYPEDPNDPFGPGTFNLVRQMNLRLLAERDYFITPRMDMVARIENFNIRELLDWTKVFIKDYFGDAEPELVEGRFDEFSGSNDHVVEIGRIAAAVQAGVPEEDIINYRPEDSKDLIS